MNTRGEILTSHRAHYLGYSSDICRSFLINPLQPSVARRITSWLRPLGLPLPPGSVRDTSNLGLREEKLRVWDIVLLAQSAAAAALQPNNTAASVDVAARSVIQDAGYGDRFTHRLGHGIGIKGMLSHIHIIVQLLVRANWNTKSTRITLSQ